MMFWIIYMSFLNCTIMSRKHNVLGLIKRKLTLHELNGKSDKTIFSFQRFTWHISPSPPSFILTCDQSAKPGPVSRDLFRFKIDMVDCCRIILVNVCHLKYCVCFWFHIKYTFDNVFNYWYCACRIPRDTAVKYGYLRAVVTSPADWEKY